MAILPPPPIQAQSGEFIWVDWYNQLSAYLTRTGSIPWAVVDKTGSKLSDLSTRDHVMLTSVQGGSLTEQYHLTSAQQAALTAGFTGTGNIVRQTNPSILGTVAADNAAAGALGEYVESAVTGVTIATATNTNVTSISLTAGDWDVMGSAITLPAGSTTTQYLIAGINTTSATLPARPKYAENGAAVAGFAISTTTPITRINVSTTTTVYLVAQVGYSVSTLTIDGWLRARRVR